MSRSKKSSLYNRVLEFESFILNPDEKRIAEALEREKMVEIRNVFIKLPKWCNEVYDVQIKKNERWFKTIVSYLPMDSNGFRRLKYKLYLHFHKRPIDARTIFLKSYPDAIENNLNTIMIYHVDTLKCEFNLVYETKYIEDE